MNLISLRKINTENLFDICELTTNANGIDTPVEEYICCNGTSIAEAKYFRNMFPLAIYLDTTPIGFVMYKRKKTDDTAMIMRFMIDHKFQHKGYGKKAFQIILDELKKQQVKKIFLGVNERNIIAKNLYSSFGFRFTGKIDKGEQYYELEI